MPAEAVELVVKLSFLLMRPEPHIKDGSNAPATRICLENIFK